MADVEVRRDSFAETTTTTTKKTKKVKKTKRRESTDHGSEVTITEIEQTTTDNAIDDQEGYVNELNPIHHQQPIVCVSFYLPISFYLSISFAPVYFTISLLHPCFVTFHWNLYFSIHFLARHFACCALCHFVHCMSCAFFPSSAI